MRPLLLLLLALVLISPAQATPSGREGFIVTDDGARLHYVVEGSGLETLVVVHGGPGNSLESVREDYAPLAAHRRVIYYDQRGNGGSTLDLRPEKLAIERHIADLDAVRAHFGLARMSLLGNSWGGALVSYYAVAHPDRVARLILDDPGPPTRQWLDALGAEVGRRAASLPPADRRRLSIVSRPENWLRAEDPMPLCRDFMRFILVIYADPHAAPAPFKGDLCAGGPEAVRRQQAVNKLIWQGLGDFDLRPQLARVRAPALVIFGESDVVPPAAAEAWAAGYGDGRLLVIPRAGHLSHLERPDIFFPAVERFLAGDWPEGAARVTS